MTEDEARKTLAILATFQTDVHLNVIKCVERSGSWHVVVEATGAFRVILYNTVAYPTLVAMFGAVYKPGE